MKRPVIGWIGLGKMGAPMCDHLLKAGYVLHVYDVNTAQVQAFAAKGAVACADIPGLAAAVDVVISMVPDDSVLYQVSLDVLEHLAPGNCYADMSTVSPKASAKVADAAAQHHIDYVCAPVSGSTELAQKAALTVFTSGPQRACEALEPIFTSFSSSRYHVGSSHQARYLKLAINHLVGSTAALMAEALVLGLKGDIAWHVMLEVMGASVIASPLVKYKLATLQSRDFAPAFSAAQMRKDMGLVQAAGEACGAQMPMAALAHEYFQRYATHSPDRDFFGVVEDVEASSGLRT